MILPKLADRACGLLAHPTSLPGPHGCGDLGASARAWLDFLVKGGQRWWQMLPIGPVGYGNSPYSAQSAFAGSALLLALEPLVEAGWLGPRALDPASALPPERVDYQATERFREGCLREAFAVFAGRGAADARWSAFSKFEDEACSWLDGFALFRAIKRAQGDVAWTQWPAPLRDREPAALAEASRALGLDARFERFTQWLFFEQWRALRAECASRDIGLIGDVPIFVAHDSADVWQNRELFHLSADGNPTVIAGVPPDYFSKTGQRWGNPLYRWAQMKKTGYRWWIDRMRTTLERFDAVRLDHFIGFTRYWEIPASEPTAVKGRWVKGPGSDFFAALARECGDLPLIAEDLGVVTPSVKRLRDQFRLPGIKVLQFAFGTDPQAPDFLPHNYRRRAVVYTGTHDNDTTMGWFNEPGGGESTRSAAQTEKERVTAMRYLGSTDARRVHWDMIRAVYASVARTAMVPLQDALGLGAEARMNHPGTVARNWEWRAEASALSPELAAQLAELAKTFERSAA
jgi:4-alpha-glucanotransferase